jgi:hypothetical protein
MATLLYEVEGGNGRIRRFFLWGAHLLKQWVFREHFLQINGTAMGTKMAPSYANIFMGKLEKLITQYAPYKPISCFRFIYDVDMKWTDSEENLNRF